MGASDSPIGTVTRTPAPVTLDGAELELCQECKVHVPYYCYHGRSTASRSFFCWRRRARCDERYNTMMTKVTEPTFLL